MKNFASTIALVLALIGFTNLNATHFAGGEIFYEHIAGTVRDYKVTLILYGDLNGAAALPPNATINYSSSCNAGGAVTWNNSQGVTGFNYNRAPLRVQSAYDCASVSAPGAVDIYSLSYQGTITLPANCNDWAFYWDGCCRNNAITNLQTPGGRSFLIVAKLNNNLGQNSSPVFFTPPVKQFCLKGQNDPPFQWPQSALESDGDSISYALTNPLQAPYTGTPIPFVNGFSVNQPMTTWNGIHLDPATGVFTFLPSQIEVDVFKVDVNEYRLDSNSGIWLFVGSTTREIQVPIVSQCDQSTAGGPKINVSLPGFSTGSITANELSDVYGFDVASNDSFIDPASNLLTYDVPIIEYNCFDSEITLEFDIHVQNSSISPDGNEFRLVGPDGKLRPIISAEASSSQNNPVESDVIKLTLHKKLDENGIYVLYVKRGGDANTLTNTCGFELSPFYAMLIDVKNCPVLDYSLDNLTVVNDKDRRIDWSITDPSYLQPGLFNYWQIGMTVGGATYVRTLNDINARSFTDTEEFFPDQVDHQNFEYWVQLVQNADFKAPAENTLITVKLREGRTVHGPRSSTVNFAWNAYNAFDKDSTLTEYQMYQRECNPSDSSFIGNWEKYRGQNTNYFFQDFDVDNATPAAEGLFAFKVEATDNSNPPPVGWISESNWLYVLVEYIPPVDDKIVDLHAPNVFTPNDDSQNDRFYITGVNGGKEYSEAQLSVFNRWGQLVYEDNNFAARNNAQQGWDGTSVYTGEKLSDGVYYYTVKFRDAATGAVEDLQGSVTLLGATGTK